MSNFRVKPSPHREAFNRWNASSNALNEYYKESTSQDIDSKSKTANGGGGGNMDDLIRRVGRLEEHVSDIRNNLKDIPSKADANSSNLEMKLFIQTELAKILTEDKARLVANEQLKSYGTATETFVEGKITASRNTMIIWTIATAIAAGSLLFGALRYFGS